MALLGWEVWAHGPNKIRAEMTSEMIHTGFGSLPWEAWTAIGTGILAIATWALAAVTWYLARRSQEDARAQIATMRETAMAQVATANQAAREQMDVTERMAKTHVATLEDDLKARLLLHYETRWDSQEMVQHRVKLARYLEANERVDRQVIQDDVPNFFESVSILLRRGHLDTEMVSHIFGYYALRYGQALGAFMVEDERAHD
jgi:hypothetical protein